jgi:hypothetical protein
MFLKMIVPSILFCIACNKPVKNNQEHKPPKNLNDPILVSKKPGKKPIATKAPVKKKVVVKNPVLVKIEGIYIRKWGVKFSKHSEIQKKLTARPKPTIYKKTEWIKNYTQAYSFNFQYSFSSNIFLDLEKVTGPPPKSLKEASKSWSGKKQGEDQVKNSRFFGRRLKRVRGPGSCGGGRCKHMLINEISGYVVFPLSKNSYIKCHIYVNDSDAKSKKFQDLFNFCLSISKVK